MSRIVIMIGAAFSLLLINTACVDPEDEGPGTPREAKSVITYTLHKLDKDKTHKLDANAIRGIVSSGKGEYVYLIGKEKATLKSFTVGQNKAEWDDAVGDWRGIKTAADHTVVVDKSAQKVSGFAPYDNGLLFTLTNNEGLVVLKGTGVANTSLYPQNAGNFTNNRYAPFFVEDKDNNKYLFLSSSDQAQVPPVILFRKYVEPPTDDAVANWDGTFRKAKGPVALDVPFLARTQDAEGNLLFATNSRDGDGIVRIREKDVGETNKFLESKGAVVYDAKNFSLDGKTANTNINTMALVDKKLLVVGLKSTVDNNGGLAVADITQATPEWKRFGKGQGATVDSIAVEHVAKPNRTKIAAIVTTDKGFWFLDNDGELMNLTEAGGELINAKAINDTRAETNDYDKAATGFAGARVVDPGIGGYLGAAQDKNGLWYLVVKGKTADENGVYTLNIQTSTVEYNQAPPTLP